MSLDVRGGKKNTRISNNYYVFIDELISNAIDAFLIRKEKDKLSSGLEIKLTLDFYFKELFDCNSNLKLTCKDNGCGFGRRQIESFTIKDSSFKDDLEISGIGKCKGLGRIQFFHYFKKIKIRSSFIEEGVGTNIIFNYELGRQLIKPEDFKRTEATISSVYTEVELEELTDSAFKKIDKKSLNQCFNAFEIRRYILISFLERFVILKEILSSINIIIEDGENSTKITFEDIPDYFESKTFKIEKESDLSFSSPYLITLRRYKIPIKSDILKKHEIFLCANSSAVKDISKSFLKRKDIIELPINNCYELILIESELLEETINNQRDGFNLSDSSYSNDSESEDITLEDLEFSLSEYINSIFEPEDFNRDEVIRSTQDNFGISKSMIDDTNIKIRYTDTEKSIAKRVLEKLQSSIVEDTSEINDLSQSIKQLDPTSENYRSKLDDLAWKVTSSIKKIDMANLSQLVVRRSAILDILDNAINNKLGCQVDTQVGSRNVNEEIIHSIFFPMREDSVTTDNHDVWILSEEYQYYDYIASDIPLSKMRIPGSDLPFFDSDIDEEINAKFLEYNQKYSRKRPDIALFTKEGSAIIIEFKAPGVELQDFTNSLLVYSRLLLCKSHGRIKKFYGYLIGDTIDPFKMPGEFESFPSGNGWFNTTQVKIHNMNQTGELYSEILYYQDFINRARNRLKVYKDKLNYKD